MGHHAKEEDPEMQKALVDFFNKRSKEQMNEQLKKLEDSVAKEIGPTGRFPEGKLTSADEGEIRFQIGIKDGTIVMDFGSKVTWVGCNADQARQIASSLLRWADVADGGIPAMQTPKED